MKLSIDKLKVIGVNYKTSNTKDLEKFFINQEDYPTIMKKLKDLFQLEEIVILMTCNRCEFFFIEGEQEVDKKNFLEALSIDKKDLFYNHNNTNAFIHLFQLCLGMDSLVVGETQITGQLKQAFEYSFNIGFAKKQFIYIYQTLLKWNKHFRNKYKLNDGSLSLSFISIQISKMIFSNIDGKNVFIIGSGEIPQLAIKNFKKLNNVNITIFNRTIEKIIPIAKKFNIKYKPLNQLNNDLNQADIIFSCITTQNPLISKKDIKLIKRDKPLLLIDLGIPRNIDSHINNIDGVYLYNMDNFKSIIEKNKDERKDKIKQVKQDIKQEVELLSTKLEDYSSIIHTISLIRNKFQNIKDKEIDKLKKSLDISDNDMEKVTNCINLLSNKFLYFPINYIRENNNTNTLKQFVEIFELFN